LYRLHLEDGFVILVSFEQGRKENRYAANDGTDQHDHDTHFDEGEAPDPVSAQRPCPLPG
jgi:hypothetical protein